MKKVSNSTMSRLLGGLVFSAAILAGCASNPPSPIDALALAKDAVGEAVSAGATELAPAELKTAQEKLAEATKANDNKDYDKARLLSEQAQADAEVAARKARAAKAEKASGAIQDDIRVLREELNRKSQ